MTTDKAILGAQSFLRGMSDGHLTELAAMCEHVAVPTRQRLFEEGTTANRFWLIDAGQVTIDTIVPGRGRLTIEVLGRGDLIGLAWLTPPYQWRFGAVTTQRMQAYQFDARAVRVACDEDPSLGYELSRRVSGLLVRRLAAIHRRLIETSAHAETAV